jgi:hypothetical protein
MSLTPSAAASAAAGSLDALQKFARNFAAWLPKNRQACPLGEIFARLLAEL